MARCHTIAGGTAPCAGLKKCPYLFISGLTLLGSEPKDNLTVCSIDHMYGDFLSSLHTPSKLIHGLAGGAAEISAHAGWGGEMELLGYLLYGLGFDVCIIVTA